MRRVICSVAMLCISATVFSQTTNTFPTTGNVGIGTVNPAYPLQLKNSTGSIAYFERSNPGSPNIDGALRLMISDFGDGIADVILDPIGQADFAVRTNNASEIFLIDGPTGNVGIGTSNPIYPLQVKTSVGSVAYFERSNPGSPAIDGALKLMISDISGGDGIADVVLDAIGQASFVVRTNNSNEMFFIDGPTGNVGIGTDLTSNQRNGTPDYFKLSVDGSIRAKELVIELGWADYVFEEGYKLSSLEEVEAFIQKEGRLPNVPSAEEVEKEGYGVGELLKIQQEKIEELTLYLLEQNKQLVSQNETIQIQNERLKKLEGDFLSK